MTSVALVCGSRKPAPGSTERSAARALLSEVEHGVRAAGHDTTWIDLREVELPWWDGRPTEDYASDDLNAVTETLASSAVIVISTPAYWDGLSGPVKNLFDLAGARPWRDRTVAGLVVGMNDSSAYAGEEQLRQVVCAVGAWWAPHSMVVPDPRSHADIPGLRRDLRRFGGYVGLLAGSSAQVAS
jgi:azobenzene reductase